MEQNTQLNEQVKMKYIFEIFGKFWYVDSEELPTNDMKLFSNRYWRELDGSYVCLKDRTKQFLDFSASKAKTEKFMSFDDFNKIVKENIKKIIADESSSK